MGASIILTTEEIRADRAKNRLEAMVPLKVVNLFSRQMRSTYTGIEALAEAIKARKQLQHGIAAALTRAEARRYIADLNALWGTEHRLADMRATKLDGKEYFIVLVAGHRRYKACEEIAKTDPSWRYLVELRFGMLAEDALSDQFTENMHEKVPPHEEAQSIHLGWLWMKKRHPELTLVAFARSLNRSPEWVRGALRFVALPEIMQRFAYDGKLAYGVLLELARLAEGMRELEKPLPERELVRWAERAMIEGQKAEDVRKLVSASLQVTASGQLSLFGDMEDTRPVRQVAAKHLIRICWENLTYLQAIARHYKDGGFNGESYFEPELDAATLANYSPMSPVRLLLAKVDYLLSEADHFEALARKVSARDADTLRAALPQLRKIHGDLQTLATREGALL